MKCTQPKKRFKTSKQALAWLSSALLSPNLISISLLWVPSKKNSFFLKKIVLNGFSTSKWKINGFSTSKWKILGNKEKNLKFFFEKRNGLACVLKNFSMTVSRKLLAAAYMSFFKEIDLINLKVENICRRWLKILKCFACILKRQNMIYDELEFRLILMVPTNTTLLWIFFSTFHFSGAS